jgi:5'-methylthioadenosine phosphorylase
MVEIAIIARVGAHKAFLEKGCGEIETRKLNTPFGPANPVHILTNNGCDFAVLSRHGEEGYEVSAPFVNDRANIWALKELGVGKIISWSAPGALNEHFQPGDLVVADDLLDETKDGPYTFFEGKGLGFIRQNPVFCEELRKVFIEGLRSEYLRCHDYGVYVCVQGPRLETRAEIRKFKLFGGDLIGMNLVPEVFLARELEICYGALCYVVNYAEGVKEVPFKPGLLFEGLLSDEDKPKVEGIERAFPEIVLNLITSVEKTPRNCDCKDSMLRYKLRGDISGPWQSWIK